MLAWILTLRLASYLHGHLFGLGHKISSKVKGKSLSKRDLILAHCCKRQQSGALSCIYGRRDKAKGRVIQLLTPLTQCRCKN